MIDKINLNGTVYTLAGSGGSTPTTSGLKVLCIGNSFCENMTEYLTDICTNIGVEGLTVYNLMLGGTTLVNRWYYWMTSQTLELRCGTAIPEITAIDYTSAHNLLAYPWDVVIFQEFDVKGTSADDEAQMTALRHLLAHTRYTCTNPNVRIGLQVEWPRSKVDAGSTSPVGTTGFAGIAALAKKMIDENSLDFLIPSGTAVMNAAMNSTINTRISTDTDYGEGGNALLEKDKLHLADGVGKYIAASCFIEAVVRPVYGVSITDSTYTKAATSGMVGSIALTNSNRNQVHQAVLYAVVNPYEISTLDFKDLV